MVGLFLIVVPDPDRGLRPVDRPVRAQRRPDRRRKRWAATRSRAFTFLAAIDEKPQHCMGIDGNVRDQFSRVIYGSRVSLQLGFFTVTLALFVGAGIGAVAGYLGGWLDNIIMRFMDVILGFPSLLLAIAIVAVLGPGLRNALIAIAIVTMPGYARVMRAQVLTIKESDFVAASRALGASPTHILLRRVIPNAMTPLVVLATLGVATAILEAAGLSFLGLGAQPPLAEWGSMLAVVSQPGVHRSPPRVLPRPGHHDHRARLQPHGRRPARRPRPHAEPMTTSVPTPTPGNGAERLLEIRGLKTHFDTRDGVVRAVDAVDLHVDRGEVLGIVGESGCGKSVMSLSVMGLIAHPGRSSPARSSLTARTSPR